jgi:hypothetical protein
LQSTQQLEQQLSSRKSTLKALGFYRPLLSQRGSGLNVSESGSMEFELLGNRWFLFSLTGAINPAKIRPLFVAMYRASRGNILMSRDFCEADGQGYFRV